jgi:hypothetical protein
MLLKLVLCENRSPMLQLDWYPKVKGRSSKGGIEADSYSSPSEPTHPESIKEECIVPIASRGVHT